MRSTISRRTTCGSRWASPRSRRLSRNSHRFCQMSASSNRGRTIQLPVRQSPPCPKMDAGRGPRMGMANLARAAQAILALSDHQSPRALLAVEHMQSFEGPSGATPPARRVRRHIRRQRDPRLRQKQSHPRLAKAFVTSPMPLGFEPGSPFSPAICTREVLPATHATPPLATRKRDRLVSRF